MILPCIFARHFNVGKHCVSTSIIQHLTNMRQQIVAGNWKMNKTLGEGLALAEAVLDQLDQASGLVVFGVPFIHLQAVNKLLAGREGVYTAAQNCHQEEKGAYTGEISAGMLASTGASFVILGHSERRQYFGEDNALLAKKVNTALANGLRPIFCCGEPLDIREAGTHIDYVAQQLRESLFHLTAEQFGQIVIAYEPIWAIGTGRTATSAQAQETHAAIRRLIAAQYGPEVANHTTLQYGGSCNAQNAAELFAQPDVDGGLIGGASLKAEDFVIIVKALKATT
jgi:triosephosphate isomerase (TIM)